MTISLKPAVIVVAILIFVGIWLGGKPATQTTPNPDPTTSPTGQNPTQPPQEEDVDDHGHGEGAHEEAPHPVVTPDIDGGEQHDWEHDPDTKAAAIATTTEFVEGWLNPDPDQRRAQLGPVAGEDLVDQLDVADLRTWSTTPAAAPELVHITGTAAQTRQQFADGRAIDLLLLLDPAAPNGWIVSDVQPSQQQ